MAIPGDAMACSNSFILFSIKFWDIRGLSSNISFDDDFLWWVKCTFELMEETYFLLEADNYRFESIKILDLFLISYLL